MRWTLYVDIDAYYVSCEIRDRPELAGRPVIVGPDPTKGPTRGVVLSASYEARTFGVRSAMPAAEAGRRCPTAVWIPPDFPKYGRIAEEVRALLRGRFTEVAALSIDEVAIGVETDDAAGAERLAREIQGQLRDRLRLPASIGVAPSRTVAKIASDRAKPAGVVVVPPEGVASFLAPLPVRAIPGVGPKTEARLAAHGLGTIGDLAKGLALPARREFGGQGRFWVRLARGEPLADSAEDPGPRSRSSDRTFETDVADLREVAVAVDQLARDLAESLAKERLRFQTVALGLRWEDFSRTTRSRTLPVATEGSERLAAVALRLLEELWAEEASERGRRVRTVSVHAERFRPATDRQTRLEAFGVLGPGEPRDPARVSPGRPASRPGGLTGTGHAERPTG
ncbi:MAG TPA: DNA polymerase IV [Thermoplasmata archaeon]|nr:DNA polymerase IV [Thermoplasmata archaeon]